MATEAVSLLLLLGVGGRTAMQGGVEPLSGAGVI